MSQVFNIMHVRIFMLIFLAFWLSACQTPVRVLVVVGGHDFDTLEFFEVLGSLEDVAYEAVYHPEALKMLQHEEVDTYDVLVFYDFVPDMPEKDSSIFLGLTHKGKPMLFLHHALCTFQKWNGYVEMVGGRYVMPGFGADSATLSDYRHDIDITINIEDNHHPVTLGLVDFVIHDEGYSNITVLDGVTPLLSTDHPESSPTMAWTHSCDQSEIVYLMLGHDKLAYENPAYQRLISQSIHWLSTR